MAGASEEHTSIRGNLHAALHAHLRGEPCKLVMVDMRVRIQDSARDSRGICAGGSRRPDEVTIFRRATAWTAELLKAPSDLLKLASVDFSLPVRAIYLGSKGLEIHSGNCL